MQEVVELIERYRARSGVVPVGGMAHRPCNAYRLHLPDLDAELFFDIDQIRGVYVLTDVKQPPKLRFNDVLRLIARLSGSLGRKAVIARWRGDEQRGA